jgi:hypothetical protein
MARAAVLCGVVMALAMPAAGAGQPPSTFEGLTVPPATLPAGCVPAPAESERHDGGRVTFGFWFGLQVPSNPWTGDKPRILSDIRSRMFGPPRMPDAPPDARTVAQINRTLVEGLSGYAAFYRQGGERVAVYALRSTDPREWTQSSLLPRKDDGTGQAYARITQGRVAMLVVGDRGPCFSAIEQHVRSARVRPD